MVSHIEILGIEGIVTSSEGIRFDWLGFILFDDNMPQELRDLWVSFPFFTSSVKYLNIFLCHNHALTKVRLRRS
jgi:hypothetical protein